MGWKPRANPALSSFRHLTTGINKPALVVSGYLYMKNGLFTRKVEARPSTFERTVTSPLRC